MAEYENASDRTYYKEGKTNVKYLENGSLVAQIGVGWSLAVKNEWD